MVHKQRFYVSYFSNAFDRTPVTQQPTWEEFVADPVMFHEFRAKKDGLLFAPVEFDFDPKTRRRRRKKSLAGPVALAVLDYDDGLDIRRAHRHWANLGCEHLIYSSFSHKKEHHKFRVILPLDQPIAPDAWGNAWLHLRDLAAIDGHSIDRSCKDASRMYYTPAAPIGTKPLRRLHRGKALSLPTEQHPDLVQHRPKTDLYTGELMSRPGRWESLQDYLDHHGFHDIRSVDGDSIHIYCPWASGHEIAPADTSPTSTTLFDGSGGWGFNCFHGPCADRNIHDFTAWLRENSPHVTTTNQDEFFSIDWGKRKGSKNGKKV